MPRSRDSKAKRSIPLKGALELVGLYIIKREFRADWIDYSFLWIFNDTKIVAKEKHISLIVRYNDDSMHVFRCAIIFSHT